ncbi:hypothetical protein K491DRAFT_763171, partial [Lophiostoma macrostomum CBS 122681]
PLTTVQKVDQVLAIGDSYTAGIGANGYPDSWGWNNCSRYYGAWPVLLSNKNEWKDFGSASIVSRFLAYVYRPSYTIAHRFFNTPRLTRTSARSSQLAAAAGPSTPKVHRASAKALGKRLVDLTSPS